ncbi:MAG: sugar phosphate nucleotidyltransferase [Candidatus Margulisiibacteriota bacterium]
MSQRYKNKKCVILCGGPGTRLNPVTKDLPKSLVPVNGRPILYYIIEYWRRFTDDFVFVVNYKKEDIIKYVVGLPINAEFIKESSQPKGIANALTLAENSVGDHFTLVLGDCLCQGEFVFPEVFESGVGVWETDIPESIKQSYSIEIKNDKVTRVVEKPREIPNNLCGLGFYFFSKQIFNAIRQTPPSPLKGRVELTDAIQKLIDAGEVVSPVRLKGQYLNLTYPEDIKRAEQMLS